MFQQMPLNEKDYQAAFHKIAEGKSVRNCIAELNCSAWMFYEGIKNNTKIGEQYAHARKLQAEASFEHILSLADKVESGLIEPNAARVAIDTYKWVAARLHPQVYQERTSLLGNVGDNTPTEITVRWASKPVELKQVNEENSQEFLKG